MIGKLSGIAKWICWPAASAAHPSWETARRGGRTWRCCWCRWPRQRVLLDDIRCDQMLSYVTRCYLSIGPWGTRFRSALPHCRMPGSRPCPPLGRVHATWSQWGWSSCCMYSQTCTSASHFGYSVFGEIIISDGKSQVRQCLGFLTAYYLSSLAYE